MTDIPFGAVVLTDFRVSDLSSIKRRPALAISTDNARRTDVVVTYITSIVRSEPDAALLAPTPENGLKANSLVRFDKIATIDKKIIAGRLGLADAAWLASHKDIFFGVFGFGYSGGGP
jgi:mRNA interferase MazF